MQTLLDFADKHPDHARAGEFLFDAAQIAERDGQFDQATELWERWPISTRAMKMPRAPCFWPGSPAIAPENMPRTSHLRAACGAKPSDRKRTAALLWTGKAQQAQNNASGARQSWEQAQNIDPTGYYSERAREILRNRTPFTSPIAYDLAYDQPSERIKADEWVRADFEFTPRDRPFRPGRTGQRPGCDPRERALAVGTI